MSDKFISMGIDDENSKNIAEVLKNETCKKILNFLAEQDEVSEQDIAKNLGIPLNTAEYNLKKLEKAGFVEKSKNFFWSMKGKKIPMYKLAKKHIIISPQISKPSSNILRSILPVVIVLAVVLAIATILYTQSKEPIGFSDELKQFSSYNELKDFVKAGSGFNLYGGFREGVMAEFATGDSGGTAASSGGEKSASDYSTTNIQVEGVDEADIVKNDDKYIYIVSGKKVVIVDAYPAENMEILSEIDINKSVNQIFINDDKLVVFASGSEYIEKCEGGVKCYGSWEYKNTVYVYDVSDREDPELEDEFVLDGNYVDSRMINNYVYVISTKYVSGEEPILPVYYTNGIKEEIKANEIYYFDYPDNNYIFTSISAIDIKNGKMSNEVYLTGYSHTLFVSQDNIYLTYQKRISYEYYAEQMAEKVYLPLLPEEYDDKIKDILKLDKSDSKKLSGMQEVFEDYYNALATGEEMQAFLNEFLKKSDEFQAEMSKQMEKTVVHKINIDKGEIKYKAKGEVPGNVLNQFSMDEYDGNFRIATTTGNWRATSLNHLYVLDEDLDIIGKVEDLAKGERIYSVRFMGERAYMVTFRQVDPLFVIDLSEADNPEVLGFLKVTGFSNYLHPYDENHIIGIGKEATEEGRVQGVKIALFDVSDVENPIEIDKYEVEGRWSDSQALYEHKAFLFDKEKNLLVIPISVSGDNYDTWYGAYVFNIDTEGLSLKGKITHQENETRGYWDNGVRRSLFMDDYLYTISNKKVKANDLDSLDEISEVELPFNEPIYSVSSGQVVEEVESF